MVENEEEMITVEFEISKSGAVAMYEFLQNIRSDWSYKAEKGLVNALGEEIDG